MSLKKRKFLHAFYEIILYFSALHVTFPVLEKEHEKNAMSAHILWQTGTMKSPPIMSKSYEIMFKINKKNTYNACKHTTIIYLILV